MALLPSVHADDLEDALIKIFALMPQNNLFQHSEACITILEMYLGNFNRHDQQVL